MVQKPEQLSFDEAACLPVSWSTAYRMLFTRCQLDTADRVLVQGIDGGVTSAAIALVAVSGATVYATSRTADKRALALELGAHAAFNSGTRLPERVDRVVESVWEATWRHSLRCLRPGGAIVIAGTASGTSPEFDLGRIFNQQLRVLGSAGSTRHEMVAILRMLAATGPRPRLDRAPPPERIHEGFAAMMAGSTNGKIVISVV